MYCQWNDNAEDDVRQFGLTKDDVDRIVEEKFRTGETHEFDRKRSTRAARFTKEKMRFVIEFTVEIQSNRPWIQAVELEMNEIV